jgi:superfamily II DNA/RNA helicase/very-short-patch-repair endonuclease
MLAVHSVEVLPVDVFEIQRRLVEDYKSYVESFVTIRDPRIRAFVDQEYAQGKYWPEALVQLNPAFESGASIDELTESGFLHPRCSELFRVGDKHQPMRLHRHQEDAISIARSGQSYVLTTGTGSGKSLAYFIPIVDGVLRRGTGRGLKAIVVYPMNALCNSQLEELEKFLGPAEGSPVSYRRYTGQETDEQRNEIRANPPDILLTNYVMLELILTRTEDRSLLDKTTDLQFLVLDELHTYRGRQGADVAMLVRRVRERTGAKGLQCVGTSATMASAGTFADRQAEVARVATELFGTQVSPDDVIGETLRPLFSGYSIDPVELRRATLQSAEGTLPGSVDSFISNPLAAWIENTFGARTQEGRVERAHPITITDGANQLASITGVPPGIAVSALKSMLMCGFNLPHPDTGRPLFAFRLHQFISRGETVFSTFDRGVQRRMTLDGQTVLPGEHDRHLYPLAFCRNCGEDYFVVDLIEGVGPARLRPRDFRDLATQAETERTSGYLWLESNVDVTGETGPFSFQPERIPDEHLTTRAGDLLSPTADIRKRLIPAEIEADGRIRLLDGDGPSEFWFITGRLPFCLHCGESWEPNVGEFTKLGTLAGEGRAGATTIISLKLVQALRASKDLPHQAQKLLSFTDNRQDASLQAGHFNDFVVTSMLRAGILAALPNDGAAGFDRLPGDILESLSLTHDEFAADGVSGGLGVRRAREVLRDVLAYRMFRDLRRGWRVNQPNLEQLGLLAIEYEDLLNLAGDTVFWSDTLTREISTLRQKQRAAEEWDWLSDNELPDVLDQLANLSPDHRSRLLQIVLDHFRREGAIRARVLTEHELSSLRDRAVNNLNTLWGFDEGERLDPAKPLRVGRGQRRGWEKAVDLTPMSRTGRLVGAPRHWDLPQGTKPLSTRRRLLVLHVLTRALAGWGHLAEESDQHFLLAADVLKWRRGLASERSGGNAFFSDFYQTLADALPLADSPVNIRGMHAREHTAQVPADMRAQREDAFRQGTLPVLYSSPTMELGVDISSLNAVNMRNVPPTPANYAQRSGRAGRANQPAIVVTYCAAFSPHDQYYFHRRHEMVAGVVTPPRIDLANRDLIASHMHAVWLAETGARLHSSLGEVLDVASGNPTLPITDELARQLQSERARQRALARCERILAGIGDVLGTTKWYRPGWLESLLERAPRTFDEACNRWRSLYQSAVDQIEIQGQRSNDIALKREERDRADRLYGEARRQRDLLIDRQSMSNDFYTYRYLASEGFLPGYNFPRLPLTAYIPGRRGDRTDGEFLQRPRFIAISEYGPGNSIYYEGNRYRVDRITLPTSGSADASVTETMKVCSTCGYAHAGHLANADVCANPTCGAILDETFHKDNLVRLQNVVTRRVERISSEEEERMRQGFDLRTAIHFGQTQQGPDLSRGELVVSEGAPDAELTYAPSAQLWRINLGWRRRKDKGTHGFWLDMTRGVWSRKEDPDNPGGTESPEVSRSDLKRVVPYVDDRQNALLVRLLPDGRQRVTNAEGGNIGAEHILSLGYAIKRGVCVTFQLEDNELAMELLPDAKVPHSILLTESSEGGAGVLTRLLEEPGAMGRVATAALKICHFEPHSGTDHGAAEGCGIACYQCLLSYTNQIHHDSLNRYLIRDVLLDWQAARVLERSQTLSRESLRDELKKLTQSSLEEAFVDWLYDHGYRLPDRSQMLIEDSYARPDFYYDASRACIYVDGPAHEASTVQQRDAMNRSKLERRGYQVVTVTYPDRWPAEVAAWPDVFGEGVDR